MSLKRNMNSAGIATGKGKKCVNSNLKKKKKNG